MKDLGLTQRFRQPRALFTGDYTAAPVSRKLLLRRNTLFYDCCGAEFFLRDGRDLQTHITFLSLHFITT
jgi:hypothetical protein